MSEQTALRRRYPLLLQVSLLLALALGVTAFSIPLRFGEDVTVITTDQEFVPSIEIDVTVQHPEPPPPPKPPAPIEVAETEVDDVVHLPELGDLLTEPTIIPPPPAPPVDPPQSPDEREIFPIVEQQPELIGGLEGLQSRIRYPEMALRAEIEGTVFVQFVVDEQGNVNDPVCVRDPGGNTCAEALRAVREAKFKPGRQRGQPVKVRFSLPVKFRLR